MRCYTFSASKLLLLLFVLLMPLQFAWAASARYCTHETGGNVSHPGHHVHRAAAAEKASDDLQSNADDPDCGFCHLSCAQPLASSAPRVSLNAQSVDIPPAPVFHRYRTPEVIERPNWFLAIQSGENPLFSA